MKTFQNISKEELGKELQWHLEQDAIIQGSYGGEIGEGEEFKGCMMGCAVNSILRVNGAKLQHDNHLEQANYLGLPEWFIYLYERIFEGLSVEESKQWVIDCFEAIPVIETSKIDDLEVLIRIFIIESTNKNHDNEEVKKAVAQVKAAILSNNKNDLSAAESSAWSAAWSAAESAAESSAWSAAESSAWSAAWSAAESAFYKEAAESAAESAFYKEAAESAAESAAWSAAWSAAESAFYKDLSKYVLQLLRGLK